MFDTWAKFIKIIEGMVTYMRKIQMKLILTILLAFSIIFTNANMVFCIDETENNENETIQTIENEKADNNEEEKEEIEEIEKEPMKGEQSAEDGTYKIITMPNFNKVFDVSANSNDSSNEIQIWESGKGIDSQKFEITYAGDGYYKIKSKLSNKVLTVESENPSLGSEITQQEDNDLDTQKWILKKEAESIYCIISKCGNLYIEIPNNNTNNGQTLQLNNEESIDAQKFILVNQTPKNVAEIQDGIYQIALSTGKVLDISGGKQENKANLQIWRNTQVQQQKFRISKVRNTGYYKIVAVHSTKNLDVSGGRENPKTNVAQYEFNGTDSQYFYFKDAGNGYYNIISKVNGLYLNIDGEHIDTNGANVEVYYKNDSDAQKFKLVPINIINNGRYEIETKIDSSKVVDISEASLDNGANVQLWSANNVNQQRFNFEAISTDTYKITAKHSGKALTVDKKTKNVYQQKYTGAKNQQWQIIEIGDNYYNLVSKENGLVLDIKGGKNKKGQNVQVYKSNGTNAQKFRFITGFRKFYESGNYGKSGLKKKGDSRGTKLKYYKYGKGKKAFFATFSIHGFEDSYAHDGEELTYIANEFKNYLDKNITEDIVNKYTIYIFPNLNPDGQKYGYTHNGPGRTTLYSKAQKNKGIDLNRCWSVGYVSQKGDRNFNGTKPFQAYEAAYLRDFILDHEGKKANILIDTHGWLEETMGDKKLGKYYRKQFDLSKHIDAYGKGYLINWARTLKNGRSALIELPEVTKHKQVVDRQYAKKWIDATMKLLREN